MQSVNFNPDVETIEESKNPLLTEADSHRPRGTNRGENQVLAANL